MKTEMFPVFKRVFYTEHEKQMTIFVKEHNFFYSALYYGKYSMNIIKRSCRLSPQGLNLRSDVTYYLTVNNLVVQCMTWLLNDLFWALK